MSMRIGRGLLLLGLGCAACAHYSTSSGIAGGIRSLAIPVAANETAEAQIAERLTARISEAFDKDGRLRVVDEGSAEAVLKLRIASVEDRPFTYTAAEETQQYRFRVAVDALLVKSEDESQLLEARGVEGWGTYEAGLPDAEGRDRAIEAALGMVIEELVDRTTAGW